MIAVLSFIPDRDKGCHKVIRDEGWGQDILTVPADLRFFIATNGVSINPERFEVPLEISDAYNRISYESKEILRMSIQEGYDFTYLACNDTFINLSSLFSSGFENYDYFGVHYSPNFPKKILPGEQADFKYYDRIIPKLYLWMDGGIGYMVSKKAAEFIIKKEPNFLTADIHHGQILGSRIKSGDIKIGEMSPDISQHFHFEKGTQRYDGVLDWQKKMYDGSKCNSEYYRTYPRGTW